jgi:hypothetical protein
MRACCALSESFFLVRWLSNALPRVDPASDPLLAQDLCHTRHRIQLLLPQLEVVMQHACMVSARNSSSIATSGLG